LPEYLYSATVVSQAEVNRAQKAVDTRLLDCIVGGCSQGQGTLTTRQCVVIVANGPERVRHMGAYLAMPPLVTQPLGERFGLAKIGKAPSKFS
jgi:hypothetical protein